MSANWAFPSRGRDPLVKSEVKERIAPLKVEEIRFGVLSGDEMMRLSEIQVTSGDLYARPSAEPAPFGCLDKRLGISDKKSLCHTCNKKMQDCKYSRWPSIFTSDAVLLRDYNPNTSLLYFLIFWVCLFFSAL
jgi:hypothetical protein